MVDLRLLQTLRVLNAQGTVTAAADALHLSPSAVSAQLRQLSEQLGTRLLQQEGRGLRLTPAGQVLLRHADVLCAQWERARADVHDHSGGQSRTLRMVGFGTSIAPLLAPAAGDLQRQNPATQTRITEADTRQSYQLLLAGDADIAVLTPLPDSPPIDDPRFDQQPLLEDYLDVVVPAGHSMADIPHPAEGIDLAAAAAEDWVSPHHDQERLIQALCQAAGFAPRMVHHADEWPAVLGLIGHGLGLCLVPRLVSVAHHPEVTRLPVRGAPPPFRRVLTCLRSGSRSQPAIAAGLGALRAQAGEVQWGVRKKP